MKRKNRREELAARHFADYYGGNSSESSVEGLYILGELETSSDDEHQHDKVVIVDNIDEDDQALQDDYYYFSLEEEEEKEPVRKSRKINKLDEDDELYYPSSEELSDFDDEKEEMEQEIDEEQYNTSSPITNNNNNFNDSLSNVMFDNEEVLSTVNVQQTNLVSEVVGTITRGKSKELFKQINKKTKSTRITNKTSENLTNRNILSISNDILIDEMFKFLTFNCIFSKLSLVCKQWYKATLEPPSVNCEYVLSLDYDYLYDTYSSETKFKKALLKSRKRFKNIQGFSIPELVLERDHICNCIFENYELFDHLKILRFEDSYIGFDYSKLANVGTLEELSFINTKLTLKGMKEICGGKLTNLKKLILNNCEGTVEHLPHANFINLEYLSIHSNIGKSLTLNIVSWFTKLTYLDLQMMTKIADETLKAISNLSLLKHLSIEYSTISQLFPFENELKNLTSLSFGNSELFENFLPNLYKANLQSLNRLNLAFITPNITEEDIQPLLNMNLKTVILSDNLKNMENYYSISKRNVYCSNFLRVEYVYRRKPACLEQTQPQEESTYPNIESSQMNESYEQLEHFTASEHIQEDIIDAHLGEELQQALLKDIKKNQQKSKKKTHTNTQKRTKKKTKPNNEDQYEEEYVFSDEEDEEYCSTSRSIITRSKTRKKLKDHPEVEIIHEQEIDEDLDEELQQALLKDIKKNQQKGSRKTCAKTRKQVKKKTTKASKKRRRYSDEETSSEDFEDRVIMTRSRINNPIIDDSEHSAYSDDSDSIDDEEDQSYESNQIGGGNIHLISDDILINEIFSYFKFNTIFAKLSLVCKRWFEASLELPIKDITNSLKLNYYYLHDHYKNKNQFKKLFINAKRFKNVHELILASVENRDFIYSTIFEHHYQFEILKILVLQDIFEDIIDYKLIATISTLSELSLIEMDLTEKEVNDICENFVNLKKFSFRKAEYQVPSLAKAKFVNLESLSLRGHFKSAKLTETLSRFKQLTNLEIESEGMNNKISNSTLEKIVELTELRYLRLESWAIPKLKCLKKSNYTSLQKLVFKNCRTTRFVNLIYYLQFIQKDLNFLEYTDITYFLGEDDVRALLNMEIYQIILLEDIPKLRKYYDIQKIKHIFGLPVYLYTSKQISKSDSDEPSEEDM